MSCNCINCPNLITVSSVAVATGVTTITIPATTTTLTAGKCYCLGLFTTVPSGTSGTEVVVTNGTTTWTIFNKVANYWRPCHELKSRTLIKLKYYDDPAHFLKI